MKYLIIYSPGTVLNITEFNAGTTVATPYNFMVETLDNAETMLTALGIDTSLITDFLKQ